MTVYSVTGFTPNFLMLGCEILLPATLIAVFPEKPITTFISYFERFQNDMRNAHARVRQTTHNVAKTQKASFDKTVKGPTFFVGQQVWLYWPKPLLRQQRKKLVKLWYGPYTIVQLKSNIVVVIRHNHTHKKTNSLCGPFNPLSFTSTDYCPWSAIIQHHSYARPYYASCFSVYIWVLAAAAAASLFTPATRPSVSQ